MQSPKTGAKGAVAMKQSGIAGIRIPNKRVIIRGGSENPAERAAQHSRNSSQPTPLTVETKSNSSSSQVVNLLYLEDFDSELDPIFISQELKPYFVGVFQDLALRS